MKTTKEIFENEVKNKLLNNGYSEKTLQKSACLVEETIEAVLSMFKKLPNQINNNE